MPTYTISGNVGVGFAAVALTGAAIASTTSASDGSYSFPGLANGNYVVTPTLGGYAFWSKIALNSGSHPSASVTVFGSDLTTSFVAVPPLIFNQLVSDSWSIDGPFNPVNWTDLVGVYDPLQISGGHAEATTAFGGVNGEQYTGIAWGTDQWAEYTVTNFVNDGSQSVEFDIGVRATANNLTRYELQCVGNGNNATVDLNLNVIVAGSLVTQLVQTTVGLPISNGDVFKLGVLGTLVFIYQNDILIGAGIDTNIASGGVNVYMNTSDIPAIQLNDFAGGYPVAHITTKRRTTIIIE